MKVPCLTARCAIRLACLTIAAIATLGGEAGSARAQATDGVRVIDIKYIFEHHDRYKAAVEGLKKEFEAAATHVQDERKQLVQAEGQLRELVPGSPDYKRLEEDLARRKAEWKIQSDKQLKDFQSRQGEINWNVYYEIQLAVQEYSRTNNIGLVIQFNGDPPNNRTAQGIAASIGRQIVYVAPDRDITPIIWRMVNKPGTPRPASFDGGQPIPPRPAQP